MIVLQILAFCFVAVIGAAVVLTRDPRRQLFVYAFYGMLLSLLFLLLQSPDVSLAEIAVGTVAIPFVAAATLAKCRAHRPKSR